MKRFIKILSLVLSLTLLLSFPVGVSAAEVEDATIDTSRKGSLTIYKYDVSILPPLSSNAHRISFLQVFWEYR